MKKIGRNSLCFCGSGKKYKKCCLLKNQNTDSLFKKLANGELPFCASISSDNGESSSMEIHGVSFFRDGVETKLLEDKLILTTNSTKGDILPSSAMISIPINEKKPEITIKGNASVINQNIHYSIHPFLKKELKIISNGELFATIRLIVPKDRNVNFKCFDIIFGKKNVKDHAHIGFYPDGNSHFIKFRGHNCIMENCLDYDSVQKIISPLKISISVNNFFEKLILEFEVDHVIKIIKLVNASFVELG